jgi:hypothetical protein
VALKAMVKLTGPLPVPAAVFSVIQVVAVLAVQAQVLALAVTVTDDVAALPGADTDVEERLNVQGGGAAACVTV